MALIAIHHYLHRHHLVVAGVLLSLITYPQFGLTAGVLMFIIGLVRLFLVWALKDDNQNLEQEVPGWLAFFQIVIAMLTLSLELWEHIVVTIESWLVRLFCWVRDLPWARWHGHAQPHIQRISNSRLVRNRHARIGILVAVIGMFGLGAWLMMPSKNITTATPPPAVPSSAATPPAVPPRPATTVSTGDLAGHKAADLYATYLGVRDGGIVPAKIVFDPSKQLATMWQNKFDWIKRHPRVSLSPVVLQASRDLQNRYNHEPINFMTLNQFMSQIEITVEFVKNDINWGGLARIENIKDADKIRLLERICRSITGNDILAYCMTELMPSADGELNVAMMSFLLRNAGVEYINAIPAQYDEKTSFGAFQFTEFALCHLVRNGKTDCRGASVVNHARNRPIPDSVVAVLGFQQFEAGYQFMVDNIAKLIAGASKKQFAALVANWKPHKDEVVVFGATAHHLPVPARSAAREWLGRMGGKKQKSLMTCLTGRLQAYGKKTLANLRALRDKEIMKSRLASSLPAGQ